MNIEVDHIVKTTPFSQNDLAGDTNNGTICLNSKSHKLYRSSNSMSNSDSFENDCLIKSLQTKAKSKGYKTKMLYHKSKISCTGTPRILKLSDSSHKCLESSQLRIKELQSENADCHRQLHEIVKEINTLQTQNKIQEKQLQKNNSQESDVPNIICQYSAEIHALQELLKSNKDKLDKSHKEKRDLDIELSNVKIKQEKLISLVENKELQEKDDLVKKMLSLSEILQTKTKKDRDTEREIEVIKKKYNQRLSLEISKYKDLNQKYKDAFIELTEIHCLLKEKTKLLDMQNIYSKIGAKPPQYLLNGNSEMDVCEDIQIPFRKAKTIPTAKIFQNRDTNKLNKFTGHKKVARLNQSKCSQKSLIIPETLIETTKSPEKEIPDCNDNEKVLFFGDTPPDVSEIEDKSDKVLSDRQDSAAEHVDEQLNVEDTDSDRMNKDDLLAKLKEIDDNQGANGPIQFNSEEKGTFESVTHPDESVDIQYSSASDTEHSNNQINNIKSYLYLPQGSAALMGSRRSNIRPRKCKATNLDFLRFPLNNGNCFSMSSGPRLIKVNDEASEDMSECEEIKIS